MGGLLMEDIKLIENAVEDLVSNLMYYDRKEDEDLPRGKIEEMVEQGLISYDIISEIFKRELKRMENKLC